MPPRRSVGTRRPAVAAVEHDCRLCCGPATAPPAEDLGQAARSLRALADPTRLGILALLAQNEALCVCHIVESFPLGQPTISHHLRLLREAGWVHCERRGTWCYYYLQPATRPVVAWALALPSTLQPTAKPYSPRAGQSAVTHASTGKKTRSVASA